MINKSAVTITRRLVYALTVVVLLSIGILLGPFVLIVSSILLRSGLLERKDPKAGISSQTLKRLYTQPRSISRSYKERKTLRQEQDQLELT